MSDGGGKKYNRESAGRYEAAQSLLSGLTSRRSAAGEVRAQKMRAPAAVACEKRMPSDCMA